MNYYEINVVLNPYSTEISEIVVAYLADFGCDSFVDTENGLKAYIPESLYNIDKLKDIVCDCKKITTITYDTNTIKTQNWNAIWESNFSPIVVDNKCTIRAPFHHNLPKTEFEIIIEPKMSFGTGHHATTYLMAEALLHANLAKINVLDMGCGTGILAILAAMKNAAHVDAVDIDGWAYENSLENVRSNKVEDKVSVMLGNASLLKGKSYGLILANINRNILLEDIKKYATCLKSGGSLIVSGIFTEDVPAIGQEAKKYGLAKIETKSRDKWARISFDKK